MTEQAQGQILGVINVARQIGYVLGVSLVVAILGMPTSYTATHAAVACVGLFARPTHATAQFR